MEHLKNSPASYSLRLVASVAGDSPATLRRIIGRLPKATVSRSGFARPRSKLGEFAEFNAHAARINAGEFFRASL